MTIVSDITLGALPLSVRASRSVCELALPCAHNAGARAVLCVPRPMLAKFVGDGMAGIAVGREVIFLEAAPHDMDHP